LSEESFAADNISRAVPVRTTLGLQQISSLVGVQVVVASGLVVHLSGRVCAAAIDQHLPSGVIIVITLGLGHEGLLARNSWNREEK
jgi:hypothetical protein